MSAVFADGQQRAYDPEVFLDEIDLNKIYQLKKFDYITIGTIVCGFLTPLTFFAGLHLEVLSLISYVLGAMAFAMGVLSIPFSIKNETLAIAEKERKIIEERVLKTKVNAKYELNKSMQLSDANFLISEYVRGELHKIKTRLANSFSFYLQENKHLKQKPFDKQLKEFKRKFKPLSQTDDLLRVFHAYINKRKHLSFSADKLFYRCALQVFLEERATYLKEELQKRKIASNELILQDYMMIVRAIFFKQLVSVNSLAHEIKDLSYEILTQGLNFKELTLPIENYDFFWQSIKNYQNLNCLDGLKLKVQVLGKNKFRKEKLILAILQKQIELATDEGKKIVLMKVKRDIESNFLYYGIFEKRYQENMLPPFDNKQQIFDNIKKDLDQETKLIAVNAKTLLSNLVAFFSGEREIYFKNLDKEAKVIFYNIFIAFMEKNCSPKNKRLKLLSDSELEQLTIALYKL